MLTNIQQAATQDRTQVPARRPGITVGFSIGKKLPHVALSGCNQPDKAFNPVGIHQMAPPERGSTHPINSLLLVYRPPEG